MKIPKVVSEKTIKLSAESVAKILASHIYNNGKYEKKHYESILYISKHIATIGLRRKVRYEDSQPILNLTLTSDERVFLVSKINSYRELIEIRNKEEN